MGAGKRKKKVGAVRSVVTARSAPAGSRKKHLGPVKSGDSMVRGFDSRPVHATRKTVGKVVWKVVGKVHVVRRCDSCDGMWVEGQWQHGPRCQHMAARWKRLGFTDARRWDCPRGCQPVDLGESFTHHWTCGFWQEHPKLTPF